MGIFIEMSLKYTSIKYMNYNYCINISMNKLHTMHQTKVFSEYVRALQMCIIIHLLYLDPVRALIMDTLVSNCSAIIMNLMQRRC